MKQIVVNNFSTSYYITEDGKCYNSNTKKYLKGQYNYKNGYLSYNITLNDGSKKRVYAHRLIAEAYIPNENKNKTQVNHIDGNKKNNCVDNLEWVTPQENTIRSIENELKKQKHVYCFNRDKVLVAEYKNIKDAANAVNISTSIIQQEVLKDVKTLSGNFYWSYDKTLGETKNYNNLGKAKEVYQYDLNGKFINKYSSASQAARSLGVNNQSHISECCRGKIKTYKGFVWRYSEDIVLTSLKEEENACEA